MRDSLGADIEARRAKTDVQLLLRARYTELGRMTGHEYAVLALFLLLVVLWLTRSPGFVPGWADLLPQGGVGDATPAVLVALLMFAVPLGPGGTPLLTWNLVQVIYTPTNMEPGTGNIHPPPHMDPGTCIYVQMCHIF